MLHTLHRFCTRTGCDDGGGPSALALDGSGNLFGTTNTGGKNFGGTLFEIGADGPFSVLHAFCSVAGCTDGAAPVAGVHIDAAGNLYGTTFNGGAQNAGVVYEFHTDGGAPRLSVLHDFCSSADCVDGSHPYAGVIADADGNLYGVTPEGGNNGLGLHGVLYKLNGTYTVLHTFAQKVHGRDGNYPVGGLLLGSDGTFYGTAQFGGRFLGGTVFSLTP
ncbi:MAG TPA: choice-of-anchor tandem repeat GloVer-containing protein [Rhizomicrobium sp.]|nr:choice-of-anchor tandem repeat GloVer-containing protein [Rhizomicrobium sp.]